jgi:hypothetical protein
VLLLSGLVVGLWGTIAPASFFGDFPGAGHQWVSPLGPYNEHLTRNVAGLNLALATLPAPEVVRAAGVAWFVWSVPHLAYHVAELDRLGPFDAVAQTVTLVLILVLAAGLTVRPGSGTRAR